MTDDVPTTETRRARRRARVTPAVVVLAAIFVTAIGFIGGVQVQKARGDDASTASGAPGGAGFAPPGLGARSAGGNGSQQGQGGSAPTTGTVKSKRGSSLYVETADGTTVRVTTGDETEFQRTAKATVDSVHPGDTVVIQGGSSDDGVVAASQVTATQSGVSPGGFGGFGGGAAGAGPPASP